MSVPINAMKLITCDLSHLHPNKKRPLLETIPNVHEYEMCRSFTADSEYTDHWVTFALSAATTETLHNAGVLLENEVTLNDVHTLREQSYEQLFRAKYPGLFVEAAA